MIDVMADAINRIWRRCWATGGVEFNLSVVYWMRAGIVGRRGLRPSYPRHIGWLEVDNNS